MSRLPAILLVVGLVGGCGQPYSGLDSSSESLTIAPSSTTSGGDSAAESATTTATKQQSDTTDRQGSRPVLSEAEVTPDPSNDAFCDDANPGSLGYVMTATYADPDGDTTILLTDFGDGFADDTSRAEFSGDGADGTVLFTICGFTGDHVGMKVADVSGNESAEVDLPLP